MNSLENLTLTAILEKANHQLKVDLPFVLYNKPNSNQLIGLFQKNDSLHFIDNFEEVGFVFAPFDGKKVVIPENQSEIQTAYFEINSNIETDFYINQKEDAEAKIKFIKLIEKGIKGIESDELTKVVLSRKEVVEVAHLDTMILFQRLLNEYPSAFTYCFFHPKVGLWLGAFSEQLLQIKGINFQTAAVAGTQLYLDSEKIVWRSKEQQEQQLVTNFILDNVKTVSSNCTVSESYNLKAGNLVHIKTDIKGTLNKDSNLKEVLEILHPTPAVCGLPTYNAKNFILENEAYNREFYSGYLGELNKDFSSQERSTDLYVNLRCVKIETNLKISTAKAHVFVGCGITKDSIPEKEWIETVNKSVTIKKILDLII
ncbi:chorismate-binding protein [Flavobacterium luteum]|uniref:Isochorismate synthase n=1 Tax=Flavobacterium luteum TaxID=2026654 RepID=A0A7J5AKM0_9FLAO|nr:chorismate-binding protein [Flavobacterium luteum]KAB1158030.1 isochorismate synthase [Flavobacterium luteum]